MVITIKEEGSRFGVRVAAMIFNKDMSKIFLQRQGNHDFYMFPGGRVDIHEESETSMKRELMEELGIEEDVILKYISENFIKFPNLKYHEIGFYYLVNIDEDKYNYNDYSKEYHSLDEQHDGESVFKWINIEDLDKYEVTPKHIKEKIKTKLLKKDNSFEHLTYREY